MLVDYKTKSDENRFGKFCRLDKQFITIDIFYDKIIVYYIVKKCNVIIGLNGRI